MAAGAHKQSNGERLLLSAVLSMREPRSLIIARRERAVGCETMLGVENGVQASLRSRCTKFCYGLAERIESDGICILCFEV